MGKGDLKSDRQTTNGEQYSAAADGRFLIDAYVDSAPPAINLVTNWWKLAGDKGR